MSKKVEKFKESVYRVVADIKKGEVMTYKEVAKKAGNSRAYRAVGSAMSSNKRPDVVPCHRVIKSNGEIGDYAFGGKNAKIKKLKIEGIEVRNGKVIF